LVTAILIAIYFGGPCRSNSQYVNSGSLGSPEAATWHGLTGREDGQFRRVNYEVKEAAGKIRAPGFRTDWLSGGGGR
jgi:hypothetical protein